MPSAKNFTKKQISDSIQMMEMLSNGNLLYSIVKSKKDTYNTIPLERIDKMGADESGDFADLSSSERSRIVNEGARCLFAKQDIKQAIRIMDRLLDSKPKVKNSGGFNTTHWKRIQKDVQDIKSSLKIDAPKITQS
ncbi:MAG: hypothetical protein D9C04_05600 [Nitrosopumilus sp. B06]|nr:MAG: hypothetical protein D9C04_05600 [Nitrosopumilus sp. B06]